MDASLSPLPAYGPAQTANGAASIAHGAKSSSTQLADSPAENDTLSTTSEDTLSASAKAVRATPMNPSAMKFGQ